MVHSNLAKAFRSVFRYTTCAVVLGCLTAGGPTRALAAETTSAERIDPAGIPGSLVICGGGSLPEPIKDRFMDLAGGKEARLVLIPTAANDAHLQDLVSLKSEWTKFSPASIDIIHTRASTEADQESFVAPLKSATAVWFGGGEQSRIADAYLGTLVERELKSLLARGGVIGGTSAGAAIQSRLMIAGGNPVARVAVGFDLLPEAVVDQHFSQRNRKPRLLRVLAEHPGHFGLGVDESTAVVVQQRRIEVLGENQATICLAQSDSRPPKEITLKSGEAADLTALRRAARDRTQSPFPPKSTTRVSLAAGSLFIVGGGRLAPQDMKKFVELAGGPEARFVVLPTAMESSTPGGSSGERRLLELAGAKNIVVLPGRTPAEVESEASLTALQQANGVWFGGGRQWRFIDAYEGTKAIELFRDVLRRGGVIGGSSAGASIQAEYMVRGSPLGNQEMMAEGYERGLGFLPGTAIDQHFTQRKRHVDMESLVKAHPQLLGIGIDESTALIVKADVAEVIGKNDVYFFDRSNDAADDSPVKLSAGGRYNLADRKLIPAN